VRLRLFFYAALCLAALPGCLSVEITTTADRGGGGERAYRIAVDQAVASMYDSSAGTTEVLPLPGDGLEKQPGVVLVSRTQSKDTSGGLLVDKRYRAARLDNASSAGDSIRYGIEQRGVWLYYRYREHYLASKADSVRAMETAGERYRFRHQLRLPGRLVTHNADSIVMGEAVWSRPMGQVKARGLVMEAASREINPLLWIVLLSAATAIGILLIATRIGPRRCRPLA
jgi:hypothetical protein